MFCRQCGTCLPQDSRFCPACGVPTDAAPNQDADVKAGTSGVPCYFIPVQPVTVCAPMNNKASVLQTPSTVSVPGVSPAKADLDRDISLASRTVDSQSIDAEAPVNPDAPLTVWQTLLSLIALLYLPIGNILFACVWAFGEKVHPTRRILARATLPLIALSLLALFGVLLFLTFNLRGFSLTFR